MHHVGVANKVYKEVNGTAAASRSLANTGSIFTGQAQPAGVWGDAAWSTATGLHQESTFKVFAGVTSMTGLVIGEIKRHRPPVTQKHEEVQESRIGHVNCIVGDGIWPGTQNGASPPGRSGANASHGGHGTDGSDGQPGCPGAIHDGTWF